MTNKARIFWFIYAVFLGGIAALQVVHSLKTGSTPLVTTLISTAAMMWSLTGVVGYAKQRRIGPRGLWVWSLWVNLLGLAALVLVAVLQATLVVWIGTFISVGITLPLLYALYEYRQPTNPIWLELESLRNRELLAAMSLSEGPVDATAVVTTADGDVTHHAHVEQVLGAYVVRLKKDDGGTENSYLNEFSELDKAIQFVESNTPIRLSDFRRASRLREEPAGLSNASHICAAQESGSI